ncbi:hypothetical protein FRB99_003148 [Tulasnella sp. 403]|nr:hypothetical protein FRB99_003148 [Tulasnella sp. 403]
MAHRQDILPVQADNMLEKHVSIAAPLNGNTHPPRELRVKLVEETGVTLKTITCYINSLQHGERQKKEREAKRGQAAGPNPTPSSAVQAPLSPTTAKFQPPSEDAENKRLEYEKLLFPNFSDQHRSQLHRLYQLDPDVSEDLARIWAHGLPLSEDEIVRWLRYQNDWRSRQVQVLSATSPSSTIAVKEETPVNAGLHGYDAMHDNNEEDELDGSDAETKMDVERSPSPLPRCNAVVEGESPASSPEAQVIPRQKSRLVTPMGRADPAVPMTDETFISRDADLVQSQALSASSAPPTDAAVLATLAGSSSVGPIVFDPTLRVATTDTAGPSQARRVPSPIFTGPKRSVPSRSRVHPYPSPISPVSPKPSILTPHVSNRHSRTYEMLKKAVHQFQIESGQQRAVPNIATRTERTQTPREEINDLNEKMGWLMQALSGASTNASLPTPPPDSFSLH